jgi:hypothetical protein
MQARKNLKQSKTIKTPDSTKLRVQANSRNKIAVSSKNVTEDFKQHNIENLNEEEINQIIQQSRKAKKHFAKTDIESYQPLTKVEKIKVLEEQYDASDKRINKYSELFKEIKTQINSLSNINANKSTHIMDDIQEEDSDDEIAAVHNRDLSSPGNKNLYRPTPKNSLRLKLMSTQSRGLFDWRDSEENPGLIHVPQMSYKSNSIKAVDSGFVSKTRPTNIHLYIYI